MTRLSARKRRDFCLEAVDVAVLAGGLGLRIRPILGETPKILAVVEGRPYVEYLLDWFEDFGARRVVLCLGHLASAVVAYMTAHPRAFDIVTVVEREPLGTAGAIRFARPQLKSDPVLVCNGDSFVDADLCAFLEHHRKSNLPASMLCTEVDDAGRYGSVEVDIYGRVARFTEKTGREGMPGIINAGVYLFSSEILDIVSALGSDSLEKDVFPSLPRGSINAVVGTFQFIDIGTPQTLAQASAAMLRTSRMRSAGGRSSRLNHKGS